MELDRKPGGALSQRLDGLIDKAVEMSVWRLVLAGIAVSEAFTFLISTVQYFIWWRHDYSSLIIAGIIDSFVVSAVVCAVLVLMIWKLRETRNSVAAEKSKVDAILAGIGEGISIVDRDFTVVYQNKLYKEQYGERTGEHCFEAYWGKVVNCMDCPIEMCFEDGKVHRVTRSVKDKDGERHLEITASPLSGPDGIVMAGVELVRDVTGIRNMEKDRDSMISRLRDELAGPVASIKANVGAVLADGVCVMNADCMRMVKAVRKDADAIETVVDGLG